MNIRDWVGGHLRTERVGGDGKPGAGAVNHFLMERKYQRGIQVGTVAANEREYTY